MQNKKLIYYKQIFADLPESKLSKIKIDKPSTKYITYSCTAQEITNIIMNNLNDFPSPKQINYIIWKSYNNSKKMSHLVITDITAGVGGNVLNFAKYFKYVNAIEIDPIRCNYLLHNVGVYNRINVNCYNDDSVSLVLNNNVLKQDIIYFDPPWGGGCYKYFYNIRLLFGDTSIENFIKKLFNKDNKMIVVKLPVNYDFKYLYEELHGYYISKYELDKMIIIIVKNY
jgi:16S rRNA G966 N2-methylase RsmD